MPFDLVTKLIALRACKAEDKKPIQTVTIVGPNNNNNINNNNHDLPRVNGNVISRSVSNNRIIKESQTKDLDRAGNFELNDNVSKPITKTEITTVPKIESKPELKVEVKTDFILSDRIEEPKKQAVTVKSIPVNKPNQQTKKEELPNDGLGRINMSDFF